MSTKTLAIATLAILTASTSLASAGGKSQIDRRQEAQAAAIEDGRRAGDITYFEGLRLRKEQKAIAEVESQYRSDGKLTRNERQRLNSMLDNSRQHIRDEKNDGWRRWWVLPRVGH